MAFMHVILVGGDTLTRDATSTGLLALVGESLFVSRSAGTANTRQCALRSDQLYYEGLKFGC
jgi:hypothetical protein